MNNEIPGYIQIAVEFLKKSFGGIDVKITSDLYRSPPPAALSGCDIEVKIPEFDMKPVKTFLLCALAEDIAFNAAGGGTQIAQSIANEVVFDLLKPQLKRWQRKFKIEQILKS